MNKSIVWADLEKENTNVYEDNVNGTYLTFNIFFTVWGATFDNQVRFKFSLRWWQW